jgi:hypothetical protein
MVKSPCTSLRNRYEPQRAARLAGSLVVHARRNGGEPQQSVMLSHRLHVDDIVHRAWDAVDAGFAEPIPPGAHAASLGVSERTLTGALVTATGPTSAALPATTPQRTGARTALLRLQHGSGCTFGWLVRCADVAAHASPELVGSPMRFSRFSSTVRRAAEHRLDLERDLVDVAPQPVLTRLETLDDRVRSRGNVRSRVLHR